MSRKKILVVAAHPDDEVLGCGGTMARLVNEGNHVYCLILGEGITSRDNTRQTELHQQDFKQLRSHAQKANDILGVKKLWLENVPDNRFDSVDLLDIVKIVEKYKTQIKPEVIFTHYEHDLNIDHTLTYQAVITATRPLESETVKSIFAWETLSSTEFRRPHSFVGDTYFDISKTLKQKLKSMAAYKGEIRDYPHPRSLKGIELQAQYRGMQVGLPAAEVFKTIRNVV